MTKELHTVIQPLANTLGFTIEITKGIITLRGSQGYDVRVSCSAIGKLSLHLLQEIVKWLIPKCILTQLWGHTEPVESICISDDGSHIVTGSYDKTIKVWNALTGKCIRTIEAHKCTDTLCVSGDGNTIVSSKQNTGTIERWSIDTGECIQTIDIGECIRMLGGKPTINRVLCVSGDMEYAFVGFNYTIMIFSINTGECIRTLVGHTGYVTSVCISSDGNTIVSGSKDKTVKIWSIDTGECIRTLEEHSDGIETVGVSGDGKYVISCTDLTVFSGLQYVTMKVWNALTGQCIRTINWRYRVHSICISRDGKRFIFYFASQCVVLDFVNLSIAFPTT